MGTDTNVSTVEESRTWECSTGILKDQSNARSAKDGYVSCAIIQMSMKRWMNVLFAVENCITLYSIFNTFIFKGI